MLSEAGSYYGSPVLHQGQTAKVKPFPLMGLLPKHNMSQYYRYHGSLTTPPCSQAVVWTLYQVPIYISWSQVRLQTKKKKKNILISVFLQKVILLVSSSAGSVYLSDLRHGGGRRAGDPAAKQLQAHPPHLRSQRDRLQRRHAAQGRGGTARQVSCSSASHHLSGKLWALASLLSHPKTSSSLCFTA